MNFLFINNLFSSGPIAIRNVKVHHKSMKVIHSGSNARGTDKNFQRINKHYIDYWKLYVDTNSSERQWAQNLQYLTPGANKVTALLLK